jgi:meso-butanediol dehydrogenase / (S,S)-butanediol dehydrogenase / diacetyl reductase
VETGAVAPPSREENSMGIYDDKVAVVTAGAQGIGEAVVRALSREGAAIVITDIDREGVESLAAELGDRCVGLQADVTKDDDMEHMVATAVSTFGSLDVAFNVAGGTSVRSLLKVTDEEWDRTLDLTLRGTLHAMRHEARAMVASGVGGAIVNVASLNAQVPMFGGASYCVAKSGVDMLTRCGALEWAEHKIRVNTLSPGLVDTQATSFMLQNDRARDALERRIPAGRPAAPAEIAEAALFLGGASASYISGTNLVVDGAWQHAAYPDLRPSSLDRSAGS